jgi:hypothetical protein
MRYFRLNNNDAYTVKNAVWAYQLAQDHSLAPFSGISIGHDECMWTEDQDAEDIAVQILLDRGINFRTATPEEVEEMRGHLPF